jgi:hypothetical protein
MKFVASHTWNSIRRVTADRGTHLVACPYVAPGAGERLRLGKGDVLVTRFDDATILAGQTDPREIVKYIKGGVEVHNEPRLHAKVYVSQKRAVIGSANVSASSEHDLLEASVEVSQRVVIADARRFVLELRGAVIGLEFARRKIKLFKTGERGRRRRGKLNFAKRASHRTWVVSLKTCDSRTAQAESAAKQATKSAKAKMKDQNAFVLDEFTFFSKFPGKEGDYVVQKVKEGRRVYVESPAQILVVQPFEHGSGQSTSVVVESRKWVHSRSLSQMDAALKPFTSKQFPRTDKWRLLRSDGISAINRVWPTVAETSAAR